MCLDLILLTLEDWKLYKFEGTIKHLVDDVRSRLRCQNVAIFRATRKKDYISAYIRYQTSKDFSKIREIADGMVYCLDDRTIIDLKDVRIHVYQDNDVWIEKRSNFLVANVTAQKYLTRAQADCIL
jgi:hypothetical protein